MNSKVITLFAGRHANQPVMELGHQMDLHLDEMHTAFVFPLDDIDGSIFIDELQRLRPTFVVDLRHFQHFNLPGVGGLQPRIALSQSGSRYLAEEISLRNFEIGHADHGALPRHWEAMLKRMKETCSPLSGPLFVLVHKTLHARLIADHIRTRFEAIEDWTVFTIEDQFPTADARNIAR